MAEALAPRLGSRYERRERMMERYFVNSKVNGKAKHIECKDFPKAKALAVQLAKNGVNESVKVLVASYDSEGKLHQVVYNF